MFGRALLISSVVLAASVGFAAWERGNLAVVTITSGIGAGSTAPVTVNQIDLETGAILGNSIDVSGLLTLIGTTTGEGGINATKEGGYAFEGTGAVLGGYPQVPGVANSAATAAEGRTVALLKLHGNGGVDRSRVLPVINGSIRDVAPTAIGFEFAYSTSGAGVQLSDFNVSGSLGLSSETNTRMLSTSGGSIFYSTTAGGNYLLRQAATGTVLLDANPLGIIVADFVVSIDGRTLYLVSDAITTSSGGLWRFTRPSILVPFDASNGARIYNGTQLRHVSLFERGDAHQVVASFRSGANSFLTSFANAQSMALGDPVQWTTPAPSGQVFLGVTANAQGSLGVRGTMAPDAHDGSPTTGLPLNYEVKLSGQTTTIASGSVVFGADSSYSFVLPRSASAVVPDGSGGFAPARYELTFDGSPWLKQRFNEVPLVAGWNLVSGFLDTGDVDDSGEVDAADIDAVIAAFGNVAGPGWDRRPDVDGSLEVDAADIDLVIANFGATDD